MDSPYLDQGGLLMADVMDPFLVIQLLFFCQEALERKKTMLDIFDNASATVTRFSAEVRKILVETIT